MLRHSTSAVVARNETWTGLSYTEPYEAAWATELLIFIRLLEHDGRTLPEAVVEISPDGIHWSDEGTTCPMPERAGGQSFCKVSHFGAWVRLRCAMPEDARSKVLITYHLK